MLLHGCLFFFVRVFLKIQRQELANQVPKSELTKKLGNPTFSVQAREARALGLRVQGLGCRLVQSFWGLGV